MDSGEGNGSVGRQSHLLTPEGLIFDVRNEYLVMSNKNSEQRYGAANRGWGLGRPVDLSRMRDMYEDVGLQVAGHNQ